MDGAQALGAARQESFEQDIPEPVRIGRIVGNSGVQLTCLLEEPRVGVGQVVKIAAREAVVFGLVAGVTVEEPGSPAGGTPLATIDLLGEARATPDAVSGVHFERGLTSQPGLGEAVYLAERADLRLVFARPETASFRVGHNVHDAELPVHLQTDELLGKHFAVLGTTGAGKSCTVSLVLRNLLAQHAHAHIVLLDLHNEYGPAFGELAEHLGPETLQLPYWLFNGEELIAVVLGGRAGAERAEVAILAEAVTEAKRRYLGGAPEAAAVTFDTPVPFRLSDLEQILDHAMGKLGNAWEVTPYLRIKERLRQLKSDRRYAFMFPGLNITDTLSATLARIFRVPVEGRPITLLDLSTVPSEILNVVVSLLLRMTFDFGLHGGGQVPVLLVCEEAHRYAPKPGQVGSEPAFAMTREALARIAKEGRKYGVSLCLVSQRPSELDPSVLSQCNTIFSLRLTNQVDQAYVAAALPEAGAALLSALPTLRNAEAVVVGEGVPVPTRVRFDRLPPEAQPRSATAPFAQRWSDDTAHAAVLADVVARWRHSLG